MEHLDHEVVAGLAAQAPDGIVLIDRAGLIRFWNRGAERIFGFAAAEVLGRSLDVIIPEKYRKPHWDAFTAAMAAESSSYGDADLLSVPATTASGATVSIEFSVVLLKGPDGLTDHVGAIIRDITARRAHDKEIRRQLLEATQEREAPAPTDQAPS
jgi:PAS domain S-box-containing protein